MASDHDLLVELKTEFRGMRVDIKELKDGTSTRLASLEQKVEQLERFKCSTIDVEKIDTRLDRVRTTQNYMIGALMILNVAWPLIIKFFLD